ncbi:ExbD/TolR family protein [Desulfosarcina sp.]|uniref:ExbD/TolR family protein n=1 Tax=Desulfosarcina sp. TaxID=2027861 RepID=UPI003970F485
MLVHRRKRPRYAVQAPLTSLIDIVFFLLVYFLLTTNFMVDEGIDIKLPQAEASKPQTQEEITIVVDARGRAFLENREVALNALFRRVQEKIGAAQDRLVVIKADRTVVLDQVVAIMDVAKAAGAGRLCLATKKGL